MIDEAWLEGLRFRMPDGTEVTSLLGTGGTDIIFGAVSPVHGEVAIRTPRQNLAWHIKEIPNFLCTGSSYNLDRINRKLLSLLGNPVFEQLTGVYHRAQEATIDLLCRHGVRSLLASVGGTGLSEAVDLLVRSPALRLRLQERASEPSLIDAQISAKQAARFLREIQELPPAIGDICPEFLQQNPLYIWGAAILDGLFLEEDIPKAARFVTDHFGVVAQHERVGTLVLQAGAIADFAAQVLCERYIERYVRFCAAAGVLLVVFDAEGKRVPGLPEGTI